MHSTTGSWKQTPMFVFFYSRLQLMICDALARVWMDADRKDRSLFCFHSLLQRLLVHLTSCRKLRCYNKKKLKWICVLSEFTFSIFAFMELNILTFNALAHAASRLPSLLISSSSSNMPVCLPGSSSGIIHWNILSEIWQELWMSTFFSPPPFIFGGTLLCLMIFLTGRGQQSSTGYLPTIVS